MARREEKRKEEKSERGSALVVLAVFCFGYARPCLPPPLPAVFLVYVFYFYFYVLFFYLRMYAYGTPSSFIR